MAGSELAVFGYCAAGTSNALRNRFARFSEALGKASRLEIASFEATSYEELAKAVISEYVDVAWLPPIPFVALDRRSAVKPLVQLQREGRSVFHSVLVVREDAAMREPTDLRGKRAAWVDRYSSSGFIVPRFELARVGVDPAKSFSEQKFWRSHEAVVRAVAEGRADFGATYASSDQEGNVVRGAWMGMPGAEDEIRVLARFGVIPSDVVAVRHDLAPAIRERLFRALLSVTLDKRDRLLANDAFGVDAFCPFMPAGYDDLRRLTEYAAARGFLDAEESFSGDGAGHEAIADAEDP